MYPNSAMMLTVRYLTSSSQKCLEDCWKLEETLETGALHAQWNRGLNPGTVEGPQWNLVRACSLVIGTDPLLISWF